MHLLAAIRNSTLSKRRYEMQSHLLSPAVTIGNFRCRSPAVTIFRESSRAARKFNFSASVQRTFDRKQRKQNESSETWQDGRGTFIIEVVCTGEALTFRHLQFLENRIAHTTTRTVLKESKLLNRIITAIE